MSVRRNAVMGDGEELIVVNVHSISFIKVDLRNCDRAVLVLCPGGILNDDSP